MDIRPIPFGLGLVTMAGGVAALGGVWPAWLPSPTGPLLTAILAVSMVYAAFLGSRGAFARVVGGTTDLGYPSMSSPRGVFIPGNAFDEELADLSAAPTEAASQQKAVVRDRLRAAAIETLGAHRGLSRADAAAQLDSGTWTDDRRARAFFATESGDGDPSRRERLEAVATGEMVFRRRAERAVTELASIAQRDEAETSDDSDSSGESQDSLAGTNSRSAPSHASPRTQTSFAERGGADDD